MLIDLDWGGQPTGEVLYQVNVITKNGQWNTFRLPESLYAEKGFLLLLPERITLQQIKVLMTEQ